MRTLLAACVVLFAGLLSAQGKLELPKALADAVAIEDQEHDLGKAEAKYRELLDGGKLDAPARAFASLRLGQLLVRLGKKEEAKPFLEAAEKSGVAEVVAGAKTALQGGEPDAERVKALREKAREIVARVMGQHGFEGNPGTVGGGIVDKQAVQDLLWIGELAEPEIIAALSEAAAEMAAGKTSLGDAREYACSGLASLLWKFGQPRAVEFFAAAAKHPRVEWRRVMVRNASVADRSDMTDAAQVFLRDPDPSAGVQSWLPITRFPALEIVDAAAAGNDRLRVLVMTWLGQHWTRLRHEPDEATTLQRFLPILDKALVSTDPQIGQAAQAFLASIAIGASVDGIMRFLREAPRLSLNTPVIPRGRKFTEAEARRLLPNVLQVARALGERRQNELQNGVTYLFSKIVFADPDCDLDTMLEMQRLGYGDEGILGSAARRVPPARIRSVLELIPPVGGNGMPLYELQSREMPAELWPWLGNFAETFLAKSGNTASVTSLGVLAARTGKAEVADWLLHFDEKNGSLWRIVPALIELGRRSQDARVKDAMYAAMKSPKLGSASGGSGDIIELISWPQAALGLALAAMGDVRAFEAVPAVGMTFLHHPFAAPAKPPAQITLLQYLIYEQSDPPHSLAPEQVATALGGLFAKRYTFPHYQQFTVDLISDAALCEIARNAMTLGNPTAQFKEWVGLVAKRLNAVEGAQARTPGKAALRAWYEQRFADPELSVRKAVLSVLDPAQCATFRTAVEARLEDDDANCAQLAAGHLMNAGIANDASWLDRLLKNRHSPVRAEAIEVLAARLGDRVEAVIQPCLRDKDFDVRIAACNYFAKILSATAVPELLSLMRDPDDSVSKAATDALAKIRLYHDQQAHWDRILKGLDASSANATEKLLLQAKPTAPHDQRLLAIRSLGALGAPEALPFLIDWITDTDAEIAAAARAAITAIHQKTGAK